MYAAVYELFVTMEPFVVYFTFGDLIGSSPHCTQGCFTPRFSNTAFHTACHQLTGVSLGTRLSVGQVSGQPVRVPFGGLRGKPQPRALSPSCGSLGTGPWVIPTLRPLSNTVQRLTVPLEEERYIRSSNLLRICENP